MVLSPPAVRIRAQLLASLFAGKMKVGNPQQLPPQLIQHWEKTVTMVEVTHQQVKRLLRVLDTKKATGSDDISPHLLMQCSQELAAPLTQVFTTCVQENVWPSVWKEARVVPVHKKKLQDKPKKLQNHIPVLSGG
ncbi:hypothetical protein E2C01_037286 [Portunus trituberculatus]|uniref:RNA-directed DNA polymerase from mobile element jockey n=1 Tax=Portunus trituberculatus TaxID=210409 RepID=A0A5B7FGN8_PORTR|nr:hypothetical protein [Portunus trituberculatus]